MTRKPSLVKHTPFGTLNFSEGAKDLTSVATSPELRFVTAHTVVFFVPTNSMLVDGATAIWRASGTTAYRSILKPGGSLMRLRFSLMASAFLPVCGTSGMFRSVVATFICLSFSMFWALTVEVIAQLNAAAAAMSRTEVFRV